MIYQMLDAITNNKLDFVKGLLADGLDPNVVFSNGYGHDQTFLMSAARDGSPEFAEVLLSAGANPNAMDRDGWTALMHAAWSELCYENHSLSCRSADMKRVPSTKHAEVVKVLLSAGADVNMKDKDGNTALMWAAWRGDPEVIQALLSANLHLNDGNARGETALLLAIQAAHQGVVRRDDNEGIKVLLSAGVDVNAARPDGETALMKAAWSGEVEIVKFLLSAGANPNAVDKDGNTVLYWANKNAVLESRPEIVHLLEEAGAK